MLLVEHAQVSYKKQTSLLEIIFTKASLSFLSADSPFTFQERMLSLPSAQSYSLTALPFTYNVS